MRTLAAALAILLSSSAFAERLILIPTGKKLLTDTFSLEFLTEPSRDNTMGWLEGISTRTPMTSTSRTPSAYSELMRTLVGRAGAIRSGAARP